MKVEPADRDALSRFLETWFAAIDRGERLNPADVCAERLDLLPAFTAIVGAAEEGVDALQSSTRPTGPDGAGRFPAIPGFEVVAALGAGGRGRVFLARQTSLSRFVALKVLRDDVADDPRTRARFLREAEIAASIEHRHIVPIYAVGEAEGDAYIAMKWLSGPALDEADVPLGELEVARIGAAVARGLHAAHVEGVIHRDVKPGNIMLDGGEPCMLDFGLARVTTDRTLSGEYHVSGTLPYMSPEQLRSSTTQPELDGRTDVYSLGATLYELAAGTTPFSGDDPGTLIRQILMSEPPPIRGIDRDLHTIIRHALAKERTDRYASAAALADDLDRFLEGRPIAARPPGLIGRGWRMIRRHRKISAVVAASLLIAAIGAGTYFWRSYTESLILTADRQAIAREIDEGRLARANVLLDALARRAPGDSATAVIRNRLRANVLLERLLDLLQERRRDQDREALLELMGEIERLGGPGGPALRRRTWSLARATASTFANASAANAAPPSEPVGGRAHRALEALSRGEPWPWALPASEGDHPADHLFTAIAMRAAGCPADALLAEIERALEADPFDYRARLQRAIWGTQHGDDAQVVLALLEGLDREGRYAKIVQRAMLYQSMTLADPEILRKTLARFRADFPRDDWIRADASTVIDATTTLQGSGAVHELLGWARRRWPRTFRFEMQEARRRTEAGELEAALRCIRAARPLAENAADRFRVDLFELSTELSLAAAASPTTPPADRALRAIATRAARLARRAASGLDRSDALVLTARVLFARSALTRAEQAINRAIKESATPSALSLAIRIQDAILRTSIARGDARRVAAIAEAGRALVKRLLAPAAEADRLVTQLQRTYALMFDASFASYLGDLPGTIESAREARALAGDRLTKGEEQFLRAAVRRARTRQ